MNFVAEPGIMLDVLEYNMLFFNQPAIKFRDKMFGEGFEPSFHYYDQLRMGKQKFEPLQHWLPLFRHRQSNANYFPFFKYFWDYFDINNTMDGFLESLKTEAFKRCCFEHTLDKYLREISLDDMLRGDLNECMRALAFLAGDGEDVMIFVPYLASFEKLIDEVIPYLSALYYRMKSFHTKVVPPLIANLENVFSTSENDIRQMHNIGMDIQVSGQYYTVCLMEHLVLSCKKIGKNELIFFTGASGKNSLKLWEDTFGINLLSFGEELGNATKYDIVQSLRKGERTISQIARLLYTSRSTVERGVAALQNAHVLSVSRHVGVETYYELNPHYFLAAKTKLLKDIDDILDDIMYG